MPRARVVLAVLVLVLVVAAGGASLVLTLRGGDGAAGAFTAGGGQAADEVDEPSALGEGRRHVGSEGDVVAADEPADASAGTSTRAQRLQWIREWLEIACGQGYAWEDRRKAWKAIKEFDESESVPLILELANIDDIDAGYWGYAMSLLGDMGPRARAAVPDLVKLLRKDEERGSSAAYALGRIGGPAIDALLSALATDGPEVQKRVITALGMLGEPPRRVTEALVGLLSHADEELRVDAIGALYRSVGAPDLVVPAAVGALSDTSVEVRSGAAMVLYMLGPDAAPAVPALGRALDDENVAQWAAMALGRIGPAAASQTDRLVALFAANPQQWARAMPQALAGIGTAALLKAIESDNAQARTLAMPWLLTSVGADRTTAAAAVAALESALAADGAAERRVAAETLGGLGTDASSSVAALLKLAEDQDDAVRRAALIASARVGGARDRVVEVLVRELTDGSDVARGAAAEALGELGPDGASAVDALAAAMNDPQAAVRERAARALESVGPAARSAASALAGRLADDSEAVRLACAIALIAVDPPGLVARDTIQALRVSDAPDIRRGVVEGLGRHPNQVWLDVVVNRVEDRRQDVRIAAAIALAKYTAHSPTVVPAVVARLEKERDAAVQINLMMTLAAHGKDAAEAIPLLESIASDEKAMTPVRDAARKALPKLR